MAAIRGIPVSLTQVSTEDYEDVHPNIRPRKLLVVGSVPGTASEIDPQVAPTIDATPADATAVATDLQAVIDALVDAGVFTA